MPPGGERAYMAGVFQTIEQAAVRVAGDGRPLVKPVAQAVGCSEGGPLAHEEVAFDRVGGKFDRSVVRVDCLVASPCSCEKVGEGGVVWLVAAESGGAGLECGEPFGRAVDLRDSH